MRKKYITRRFTENIKEQEAKRINSANTKKRRNVKEEDENNIRLLAIDKRKVEHKEYI